MKQQTPRRELRHISKFHHYRAWTKLESDLQVSQATAYELPSRTQDLKNWKWGKDIKETGD